MKILLVDDEAIALQTMENIIRQSDFKSHTILTATNAADAWTIIQTKMTGRFNCDSDIF